MPLDDLVSELQSNVDNLLGDVEGRLGRPLTAEERNSVVDELFSELGKEVTVTNSDFPSDSLNMTPVKACQILKDGTINGRPLTDAQKGMFGALCGQRDPALRGTSKPKGNEAVLDNANPEGINQYSGKGGSKGKEAHTKSMKAHEASSKTSESKAVKNKSLHGYGTSGDAARSSSRQAAEAAAKGNHSYAEIKHKEAASHHREAAKAESARGSDSKTAQHTNAASLHTKAAEAHSKVAVVGNSSPCGCGDPTGNCSCDPPVVDPSQISVVNGPYGMMPVGAGDSDPNSLEGRLRNVYQEFMEEHPPEYDVDSGSLSHCSLINVYEGYVIYQQGDDLYKEGYSFDDSGDVTFAGDPKAVDKIVTYVPDTDPEDEEVGNSLLTDEEILEGVLDLSSEVVNSNPEGHNQYTGKGGAAGKSTDKAMEATKKVSALHTKGNDLPASALPFHKAAEEAKALSDSGDHLGAAAKHEDARDEHTTKANLFFGKPGKAKAELSNAHRKAAAAHDEAAKHHKVAHDYKEEHGHTMNSFYEVVNANPGQPRHHRTRRYVTRYDDAIHAAIQRGFEGIDPPEESDQPEEVVVDDHSPETVFNVPTDNGEPMPLNNEQKTALKNRLKAHVNHPKASWRGKNLDTAPDDLLVAWHESLTANVALEKGYQNPDGSRTSYNPQTRTWVHVPVASPVQTSEVPVQVANQQQAPAPQVPVLPIPGFPIPVGNKGTPQGRMTMEQWLAVMPPEAQPAWNSVQQIHDSQKAAVIEALTGNHSPETKPAAVQVLSALKLPELMALYAGAQQAQQAAKEQVAPPMTLNFLGAAGGPPTSNAAVEEPLADPQYDFGRAG